MFLIKIKTGVYYIKYKQYNGKWTQETTGTRNKNEANRKLKEFSNKNNSTNNTNKEFRNPKQIRME